MRDYVSRRQKVAAKKNFRSAWFFSILTISTVFILAIFGVPLVVKYVSILTNLNHSSTAIESDDKTPPPPPTFQYFPESTKENSIEIKGYTEPGATVKLYVNSEESEVVADNEGNFSYKLEINDGEYTIEAVSKDNSGNESKRVYAGKVTYDNTAPEITITSPSDNQQIFGSTNKQITIMGKTEEDTKLNINGRSAIVSSDGTFSITFTLSEGTNTFNFNAEDKAGNKTEKTLTVSFSL